MLQSQSKLPKHAPLTLLGAGLALLAVQQRLRQLVVQQVWVHLPCLRLPIRQEVVGAALHKQAGQMCQATLSGRQGGTAWSMAACLWQRRAARVHYNSQD